MSGTKIKTSIAIIGTGYWGDNLMRNFHALGVLEGVHDQNPVHARNLTETFDGVTVINDIGDIWSDPSITGVVIATPAATHSEFVKYALESGKDVYVEKPLSLSESEGKALVALAQERNRILMGGTCSGTIRQFSS